MSTTRFDLEQMILECWQVTNDIDHILDVYEQIPLDDPNRDDQIMNLIIGIKTLYDLKFQKCFNLFEKMIKDGQVT